MKVIRGLHNLRAVEPGTHVAIGNFDGLHRGHQAILRALRADAGDTPLTLVTFEPTPREYFDPDDAPPRLSSLRETAEVLRDNGWAERLLCLRFDARLAAMSPDDFAQQVLAEGLGAQRVMIGDDFRYGAKRAGTPDSLRAFGQAHGFDVVVAPTVTDSHGRISSTRVREHLLAGDVQSANRLLGRSYSVSGRVQTGERNGRRIGFPTANLNLKRRAALRKGVYAVTAVSEEGRQWSAVANFGTRPTVSGTGTLLEVHCLDDDPDLYGSRLWVCFHDFIRGEQRFDDLDALATQIRQDADAARQLLET